MAGERYRAQEPDGHRQPADESDVGALADDRVTVFRHGTSAEARADLRGADEPGSFGPRPCSLPSQWVVEPAGARQCAGMS